MLGTNNIGITIKETLQFLELLKKIIEKFWLLLSQDNIQARYKHAENMGLNFNLRRGASLI
jgi:hypothetical protein